MKKFLSRLFKKNSQNSASEGFGDMRSTPVNNPLDVREDGSIREGDPAWAFMMEVMNGDSGIANQRADGTWETKVTPRAKSVIEDDSTS